MVIAGIHALISPNSVNLDGVVVILNHCVLKGRKKKAISRRGFTHKWLGSELRPPDFGVGTCPKKFPPTSTCKVVMLQKGGTLSLGRANPLYP